MIALIRMQGWKYQLVIDIIIDTTFFAFLLSIIADALLSIFPWIIAFSMLFAYILSIGRIFKLYFCSC